MKILIIEDEPEMAQALETFLIGENFLVESARDYDSGIEKIFLYQYDCILLDITIPGGSGLKILTEMRQHNIYTATIIISAKGSVDDRVNGLGLGADDYLAKPFHLAELHARIKAVIRRRQQGGQDETVAGNVSIDSINRTVKVGSEEIKLNRKEFDILSFLAANINKLITRESLAEYVWGDNIDSVDSMDFVYSQVKNLRKRLKNCGANISINNVYGVGYRMTL